MVTEHEVEKEGRELVGRYEMYVHNRGESAFAFVPCLFIFASFLPFFSPTPTDSAALEGPVTNHAVCGPMSRVL